MEYFLERIARSITDEFGNSLNRHCLVFPSRRAGLYFLKYVAARIQKPVWAPPVLTINELFRSFSSLQNIGNELLLFELYKTYRAVNPTPESFDDFYYWGDMLLNDFDDIDKYLVNASQLFSNIKDIKTIDNQFSELTESQVSIIKRFWTNFNPDKPTNEKTGFIATWSILYSLYSGFRESLIAQNLAYEGMIFRELAENPGQYNFPDDKWDMIHFIGFNALNECEKEVMKRYKKSGKARIYWDYDNSYITESNQNSAGYFLRENLKIFGNDMPADWSYETMVSAANNGVSRKVIETSSDVAQVKLVARLIEEIPGLEEENAHNTAIVLADENLLIPLMTSLPEDAGDINVTMGYPLKQTLVYTLLKHIMDLQSSVIVINGDVCFSYVDVLTLLKHSLVKGLMSGADAGIIDDIVKSNMVWVPETYFRKSEYLGKVFHKYDTPALISSYLKDILSMIASHENETGNNVQKNIRNEFIYRVILSINKLERIISNPDVTFNTVTYIRILDRMLRIQSVPFSGEPLSGIQIMGILETRALDFKNLIILSVNEGNLPALSAGSSFIPVSLREAFKLPSLNHQESIYAYHFFRLLQRAENVVFVYNSNSEGLRSGEMSRFLIQMKYDEMMKPVFRDLTFEIKSGIKISDRVERTDEHMLQLSSRFNIEHSRVLSPSAINTWLSCRMKFYFRYVNNLKESPKVISDIEPAMIGNILHDIMKSLYEGFINQVLTGSIIEKILSDKVLLQKVTEEAIRKNFNNGIAGNESGNEIIMREVLIAYLLKILTADKFIAPVTIKNLEDSFSFVLPFASDNSSYKVNIGGKVDRIDIPRNTTRIVDYKTGLVCDSIHSISDLFADDRKKESDGWLQTLIYCEAYLSVNPGSVVRPSVYKIRKMAKESLNDSLRLKVSGVEIAIDDYNIVREEFLYCLKELVSTIFNKNEPFTMTCDIRGKCSFCPYSALCLR